MPEGSSSPIRFTYDPSKYKGVSGSGADKLAASGVAPLVAAARGYATVLGGSAEHIRNEATRLSFGPTNTGRGLTMKRGALTGDVMVMPLFDIHDAYDAVRDSTPGQPSTYQFRPKSPVQVSTDAKLSKYLFAKGETMPLDVHPALPASWYLNPVRLLISEGTLKTDSALTAIMVAAGVSEADLNDTSGDPASTMRAILETLPQRYQVLCISFAGVGNWHNNPQAWMHVPLNQHEVWIAFDKDIDINTHVWSQGNQLFNYIKDMKGIPKLVDLSVKLRGDDQPDERAGLDDFLVKFGGWRDLSDRLISEMPERPVSAEMEGPKFGEWRINDEDHCAEEYTAIKDAAGRGENGYWEPKVPIAGHISRIITRRGMTAEEENSGVFNPHPVGRHDQVAIINVSWEGQENVEAREFRIPGNSMGYKPADWPRNVPNLPLDMLTLACWPPDPKWLAAVKNNQIEDRKHDTEYDQQGWVITKKGPRFISGTKVIGPDGFTPDDAVPGVTEDHIADIDRFGVDIGDNDDELREDIDWVIATLTKSTAFTDRGLGVLALAAGLRPTVPVQANTSVLVTGPPSVGKSFWASMVMQFWAGRIGAWNENKLPGNLKSTRAANEALQARTVLCVYDDAAPSASRYQSENEQMMVGEIIRNFFNQAIRKRMNQKMENAPEFKPRSLPIVTAENPLPVDSEMARTIHYRFYKGSLGSRKSTDTLVQMRDELGCASRVTGACIKFLAKEMKEDGPDGWVHLRTFFIEMKGRIRDDYLAKVKDDTDARRSADSAADMALGLGVLKMLCEDLGMDSHADDIKEMLYDLFDLVEAHRVSRASKTPGASLMEALRAVLVAGAGHISLPDGTAPGGGETGAEGEYIAQVLGWVKSGDGLQPRGENIGMYATISGRRYVLFDQHAAFAVAQRKYPRMIPFGATEVTAWGSAWDEGIAGGGGKFKRRGHSNTTQVRVGTLRPYVVPVLFDELMPSGTDDDDAVDATSEAPDDDTIDGFRD